MPLKYLEEPRQSSPDVFPITKGMERAVALSMRYCMFNLSREVKKGCRGVGQCVRYVNLGTMLCNVDDSGIFDEG